MSTGNKVDVGWPCDVTYTWRCGGCVVQHVAVFAESEPGDHPYDSLDRRCKCGRYWKKTCRITPEELVSCVTSKPKPYTPPRT